MEASDYYKPIIIDNFELAGVAAETAARGQQVKVIQKLFISSLDDQFSTIASSIFDYILGSNSGSSLNSLLVLIKPDKKGYIYKKYPFGTKVILKKSLKAHHVVYRKDIADIDSVFFKDDLINLNPDDGDMIIWLFRENWCFGLYFDLSGTLIANTALEEMGYNYKRLCYLSEYEFVENSENFDQIIKDGWFPFIALIGDTFSRIQSYYKEGKKHQVTIDEVINKYDKKAILELVERWWNNSIFSGKKKILMAGINSYLEHTEDGYINAIKNLITELEGIVRISYHNEHGEKPSTDEIKKYISDKGKEKFKSTDSLGFPDKFYRYLSEYIFKGFDIESGEIPGSRHSIAHGVADDATYKRDFAFKLILTLDQVYFFLGNN